MIKFVLVLVFSTFVLGTDRIVGGHDAGDGKYLYQVSVRSRFNHICGGSVIGKRFVLTAAHCIYKTSPDALRIRVGTHSLFDLGNEYKVERLIPHENFNYVTPGNDIGLIRVVGEIEFNQNVAPIQLAGKAGEKEIRESALVTGWGRRHKLGVLTHRLQEINLTLITVKECRKWHRVVTDKQLCTLTKNGEGVCMGDSGGPLVLGNTQIGVVSFGIPCAVGVPDVFTKIESYTNWIHEKMNLLNG